MSQSIDLNPVHHKIVADILYENIPGRKVLVFGSRAKWTAKNSSDLDLCITGDKLDSRKLARLAESFDESALPFKVDIVEWEAVEDRFREIIRKDGVELEWPRVSLGLVADINSETIGKNNEPQNIRYIDISSVGVGQLTESPKYMPFKDAPSRARRLVKENDIVISTVRPNRKSRFYVTKELADAVVSTGFAVIRPKPNFIDPIYLYALICSEDFVNYLVRNEKGAAYPAVTQDIIAAYTFTLPPVGIQELASGIVDPVNRKIELNQRMNETLEAMARALFKSWFVDFDPVRAKAEGREPEGMDAATAALFPAAFNDDGLPDGWTQGTLGKIADSAGVTVQPNQTSPDTPYIGLEHMPRRCIALSEWAGAGKVTSNKFSFMRGDFLFGKLRPYFHKVGIAAIDGISSTDILIVRPKSEEFYAFVLSVISSDEFVGYTDQTSRGTKMPRTNWKDMAAYEIALPDSRIALAYNAIVKPMLEQVIANIHENRTLSGLRDTLLPKLISGELRIGDAEDRMREAV